MMWLSLLISTICLNINFINKFTVHNPQEEEWPSGQVIHFVKSNWDGSNKGFISTYYKEDGWVESMKWHEGNNQVSVIPALINRQTFSVDHFINIACQDGECNQRGEMFKDVESGNYIINFGSIRDTITGIPDYWHSYDFDWASLATEFLFRKSFTDHRFMRCDFTTINGQPGFGLVGEVSMKYQGISEISEIKCHMYSINGPGLHNRGGEIWFATNNNRLMGFKIDLPDEDSYQNVDFRYIGQEKMSSLQWEAYKKMKYQ